ncbi:MAG: lipopolysaccharide heptosyltransferase II [Deltaproteobacteria bacterium]|nr:lipopolysaccharide heptosyltransferase II [Deltaproteobacteria bacterium]
MQLKEDKNIKNILIRSTNWVGDAIMTTPAIQAIRQNFPKAKITILAKPWVKDVFAANPCIDHVIVYDSMHRHKGLRGQVRLAKELAEQDFDLAILLQNAFEAAWLAYLARIPRRAGYKTDARSLLLTHSVPLKKETKKIHQVYYYLRMLEGLGLEVDQKPQLFLKPAPDDIAWARKALLDAGVKKEDTGGFSDETSIRLRRTKEDENRKRDSRDGCPTTNGDFVISRTGVSPVKRGFLDENKLIGINPGAAYGPAKRWLPERFVEVAGMLTRQADAKVVVFGTNADRKVGEGALATAPERVINMAGKTTLGQAMALMARCRVFITNDSGLMHVAAALHVPLVAIFGSTNPVTTGPFSDRVVIVRKDIDCSPCLKTVCPADFRCMKEIMPEEIYMATLRMLER